jgi:Lrp/AsnC family leucine-responsive transcriptional regulator
MSYSLDETDLHILSLLQSDGRMQNAELAKQVGMAPSAMLERVKKLEQKGIIQNYIARVNPDVLELKLLAFIFVKSNEGPGQSKVSTQLAKLPEVLELHHIAGEDCYIMKIRAKDPQSLAEFMREKLRKIPNIVSTKTTIVLETVKEKNHLPIPKN